MKFLRSHDEISKISVRYYFATDCPSADIPISTDLVGCHLVKHCSDIHCCVAIDIKVKQLFVDAWLTIDPCNFTLSVGLGNRQFTSNSLAEYNVVRESRMVARPLNIR